MLMYICVMFIFNKIKKNVFFPFNLIIKVKLEYNPSLFALHLNQTIKFKYNVFLVIIHMNRT